MRHLSIMVCGAGLLLSASQPRQAAPSRFAYAGHDAHMLRALQIADSVLETPAFWAAVRAHPSQQLDNSAYTMAKLAETLHAFKQPVTVYRSRSPFHFIATADTDDKGTVIYWKGYRQSDNWLAITIIHEWVHGADFALNKPLAFAHFDDQNPCVSRNTASYRIEQVAVDLFGRQVLGETQFEKRYNCKN